MTMKSAFVILALLGVTFASHLPALSKNAKPAYQCNLQDDLNDFLALIDEVKIVELTFGCLEDPEIQMALFFFFDPEFHTLWVKFFDDPHVDSVMDILRDGCIPVDAWATAIRDFLGIQPRGTRTCGGMSGYLNSLLGILPVDDIRALAREKLETSPDFARLFEILRSEATIEQINILRENPVYKNIVAALYRYGVDVERIIRVIYYIFNV